ncbi:MAG: hypothetical protein KKA32_16820 [Actinobacteria bacterium]|nr:hypothetical protein [Actinomycetota bacterium]
MEKHEKTETRPSILAMLSTAIAAAVGFFVITRSGIAGTLVGAAVFSVVYTGAAHWIGHALERLAGWWLDRRGMSRAETPAESLGTQAESLSLTEVHPARVAAQTATAPATDVEQSVHAATESATEPDTDRAAHPSRQPGAFLRRFGTLPPPRKLAATWGPLLLAVAAFGASGYSIVTGTPIERVIVRERVVEKPVVEERIIVQHETVTVTVPVPGTAHGTVTVTPPPSTTPTTLPPGTSTSTTGVTPSTTTSTTKSPPPTTTSTAPGASSSTTQTTAPPPDTGTVG